MKARRREKPRMRSTEKRTTRTKEGQQNSARREEKLRTRSKEKKTTRMKEDH